MNQTINGETLHSIVRELFPIFRSITGEGVRQTLAVLQKHCPVPIYVRSVRSGSQAFDWTVPAEWRVREAWIKTPSGEKIADISVNNLHLVNYSQPVHQTFTLQELQPHLHSLPDQPDAIPYVTSYYKSSWGFCLTQQQRDTLIDGDYEVYIDSEHLADGELNYGECYIAGRSEQEILISTYICHPSMANNELSGPVIALALIHWLSEQTTLHYSYRIVFTTETIGTLCFLQDNLQQLKQKVVAGFVLSCIGDEGHYSIVHSRYGHTLADRVANLVLEQNFAEQQQHYSFLERGSDERQYCAPGIDLPVVTLCRTKFGKFSQYHTSLDDLSLVTEQGLQGGFSYVKNCLEVLEKNRVYRATCLGEPQLGKYNLYPSLSLKGSSRPTRAMTNVLAYCDGQNDLLTLCQLTQLTYPEVQDILQTLRQHHLVTTD
ncbi:DUF4910 domain-containing protein [Rheinheimera sp.]|uniref:DUF4910 domain-containing protein n=1 Tax=Rheinheimera sp. TaxID=1869214 RepID=UPI00307E621D